MSEEIEVSTSDKIIEAISFLQSKLCKDEESTEDFNNMINYVKEQGLEVEIFVATFNKVEITSTKEEILKVLHDQYDAWDI